jgi:hypothetical protein
MECRTAGILRIRASRSVSAAEQVYGLPVDTQFDPFAAVSPRCAGRKRASLEIEHVPEEPFIATTARNGEITGYVERQRNMVVMKKRK